MSNQYNQLSDNIGVHFSNALFGECERSAMKASPIHLTAFNAGELVPIYCREILPNEDIEMNVDFVIRQSTLLKPTMGSMKVDLYAFFVPNRIVNQSWKAVQGENLSGSWTANEITLATLVPPGTAGNTQIPIGSVADYYGFPTQAPLSNSLLAKCNDLKFRGYVMIYNEFFRDQNYQPPIPISTLNVDEGFITAPVNVPVPSHSESDGSVGAGSIANSLYGSGESSRDFVVSAPSSNVTRFKITDPPLKVNKLHDYFTSVLPSPQKSSTSFLVPVSGEIGSIPITTAGSTLNNKSPLKWTGLKPTQVVSDGALTKSGNATVINGTSAVPSNLVTNPDASIDGLTITVDDIRMASAIQQVYETLARGGSRYRELVSSFFGIEADDPYSDIPKCIGHISKDLDLFQTAQTAPSVDGGTPQGNLAAFGYTTFGSEFIPKFKFLEHGYLHVFACVRHRNIYPTYLAPDNFRLTMLDFYTPPLANISEQPVYTKYINPFADKPDNAFGFQEAWSEYRYEPDVVSSILRPGVDGSLAVWHYADPVDKTLEICDGNWLKSNSKEVLDRTLAVKSNLEPQLIGQFKFSVNKELPMPTYSVPGLDII